MMARRRAGRVLAGVLVAMLALGGCTGVPTSSDPQTIQPINVDESDGSQQSGPPLGIQPRELVSDFLDANAIDPADHRTARRYLTSAARDSWNDQTAPATIVTGLTIGVYTADKPITVRAQSVATLSSAGVYSPTLEGTGGGSRQTFTFRITQFRGEYRISGLPSGLVLTTDQFARRYRQHPLYFFDTEHRFLVPDPRWTARTGDPLGTWLMQQLAIGPRAELRNAVATDVLPAQANTRRLAVTGSEPLKVEIPGSSRLDDQATRRLAAQTSTTLTDSDPDQRITMTDSGTEVALPGGAGTEFSAAGLKSQFVGPPAPAGDVYYLADGKIRRGTERTQVRGKLSQSPFLLDSIAVGSQAGLTVAGVSAGADPRLMIGTQEAGYKLTTLRGAMSRPTWAPGRNEVWIGLGGRLIRIPVSGNVAKPVDVSIQSATAGGRIVAIRLSPEGSRIAMVISSAGGSRRLYIGSVVRSPGGQVRVDSLIPISPEGAKINDVAWLGPVKLISIGATTSDNAGRIFETNVDGAFWIMRGLGALPDQPDSITAATNQLAWVSTNDTVWEQDGRSWTPAGFGSQTPGDKPTYLE